MEDYLTFIWKAGEWPGDDQRATTSGLATTLGVTPSTVSATLKKLAREGLIRYEPYGAIELTERGEAIAVEVVRRHRIIETYLVERLQLSWDQVHDEADRLEHAVSDLVLERMDEALGHPEADPHGDPIPRPGAGRADRAETLLLSQAPAGTSARIVRISDRSPEILRLLAERGLTVGQVITVEQPLGPTGVVAVRLNEQTVDLSEPVAAALYLAQL